MGAVISRGTDSKLHVRSEVLGEATDLLKLMANNNRLAILFRLADGESSVGELEDKLGIRQPTLSQQLGELRKVGLISDRREGKVVFYSLSDDRARSILLNVHNVFCPPTLVGEVAPTKDGSHPEKARRISPQVHAAMFARILDHEEPSQTSS